MMQRLARTFFALFLAGFLAAPVVFGDDATHRAAAEELLLLMEADKQPEMMVDAIQQSIRGQMSATGSEEAKQQAEAVMDEMLELVREAMSWEAMSDEYINVYVETFSEDEIRDFIGFYSTPSGRKFVQKMPEMMQRSMAIGQRRMAVIQPKIEELVRKSRGAQE